MSIPTKLVCFLLLLLLVQYTCASDNEPYFEIDVLMCKQKCGQKDPAQCDKDCLQPYKDWDVKDKLRKEENIFVFHASTRFTTPVDDQHGYIKVSQSFETRSDVFQGIRNRLVLSRANPATFLSPSHRNVDSIAVVVNGRAWITLIHQGNKETHNVQFGDIIRIRAGTIVHYINPDTDLQLFHMLEFTVNTPDDFESFFAAGSNNHQPYFYDNTSVNRESFYNAFSDVVIRSAFNTDKDKARKLFQGHNEYVFVKVSQEQIKALLSDQNSSKYGNQRFSRPYNIFNKDPSYSNIYGKLHEINPRDYKQIQDLDIQLTYANITKGAMFGPYHNTRSATVAMALGGSGYFQVASPYLSRQQGASYNASAELLDGDVFVIPAGHPVVIINSGDTNLQVLYFEVNARGNKRIPLAGMNNVLKQLGKEMKQLSFNMSSEQVDDILDKQKKSWFFPVLE